MKHCLSEELAARYVEGRATDVESREIAGHLEACPECCALIDALALVYDLDAADYLKDPEKRLVIRCVWNGYSLIHWRKNEPCRAAEEMQSAGIQNIAAFVEHQPYPAVLLQRTAEEIRLRFAKPHPVAVEIEADAGNQVLEVPFSGEIRFPWSAPAGALEVCGVAATGNGESTLIFNCRVQPE